MKSVLSFIRDVIGVLIAALLFGAAFGVFIVMVRDADEGHIEYTAEVYAASAVSLPPEDPAEEGVGRFEIYVEGEGEPPEWYRPDEEMAAEWSADETIYGWDGRTASEWEMDLFSKIFYLEFWGTSDICCEAGCDAILNLWESGLFGETLGDALSAKNEQGAYVYSTFPYVWSTVYDADGLAWCRAYCEERFKAQPEWCGVYFKLGGYHDTSWSTPVYAIDGVYFSTFKEGTR